MVLNKQTQESPSVSLSQTELFILRNNGGQLYDLYRAQPVSWTKAMLLVYYKAYSSYIDCINIKYT